MRTVRTVRCGALLCAACCWALPWALRATQCAAVRAVRLLALLCAAVRVGVRFCALLCAACCGALLFALRAT